MKDIIRYTEGDWYVVAREHGVAMLPPSVPDTLLDQIWIALDSGGLSHVIEALTVGAGLTLWELPPFAVAVVDGDDVRVAVRGDVRLTSDDGGRHDSITGGQAHTWVEQVVPTTAALVITPPGATVSDASMPLASGVVRGGAVTVGGAPALRAANPAARRERRRTPSESGDAGSEEPESPAVADAAAASETETETETNVAAEAEPEPENEPEPGSDPEPEADASVDGDEQPESAPVHEEASEPGALSDREIDEEFAALADRVGDDAGVGDEASFNDHDGLTIDHTQLPGREADVAVVTEDASSDDNDDFLGRVVLSTGRVLTLERSLVIGRRPRITRTSGNAVPALVTIDSPTHDISRNHVEIRREGDMVLVTDLDTTNGTLLLRGQEVPRRLHPGEATLVVNADVIDIGDGVTITFEDLP